MRRQRGAAPTAPWADSGAGVVVEQGWQSRRAGLGRASCVQLRGQQEADALNGGAGGCLRCGGLFRVDGGTGSSSEKVSLEPALCHLPRGSASPGPWLKGRGRTVRSQRPAVPRRGV